MHKKPKSKSKKTLSIIENTRKHSQFDYAEVYRHIRTNIEFSTIDKNIKSVAITSTQPNEAKSTTALNLAFSFAAKYKRVLLIDCDLRNPSLHKFLRLSNLTGLTNSLINYRKTHKVGVEHFQKIEHPSFVNDLTILTSGIRVANPSELLSSNTFKEYMEVLYEYFDFIVIDCAPAGVISDAIPIGNVVDGTIFIVSCQDTNRKDALYCIKLLQRNNVNILGSVLTKADTTTKNYYYYYG